MKLFWTVEAITDRRSIYRYIAADNLSAARALDERFRGRAAQLLARPLLGRVGREPGTRESVVHRNYIIVYDISGESVRILRILHAAQKWPR